MPSPINRPGDIARGDYFRDQHGEVRLCIEVHAEGSCVVGFSPRDGTRQYSTVTQDQLHRLTPEEANELLFPDT